MQVSVAAKSFPPRLWGADVASLRTSPVPLEEFMTPLVTLSQSAIEHNLEVMSQWTAHHGVLLAPHGKTTMSPRLWQAQLDKGAIAITLATPWQALVAHESGIPSVFVANEITDPVGAAALASAVDDGLHLMTWVDSTEGVDVLSQAFSAHESARCDVIIDIGADGGRTGVRRSSEVLRLAELIHADPVLNLAGVGGYEGAVPHAPEDGGREAIRRYLTDLRTVALDLQQRDLYDAQSPIITAGGSAFFDEVVTVLGDLTESWRIVLRSGAYIIHDDGYYRHESPWGAERGQAGGESLIPAMHGWARVVSAPEPGLLIVDAGKRDFPFDEGLPMVQRVLGRSEAVSSALLQGATVTALNDQHMFVSVPAVVAHEPAIGPGEVLRFGLSHPCTALDKWRLLAVVDEVEVTDVQVVDAYETRF